MFVCQELPWINERNMKRHASGNSIPRWRTEYYVLINLIAKSQNMGLMSTTIISPNNLSRVRLDEEDPQRIDLNKIQDSLYNIRSCHASARKKQNFSKAKIIINNLKRRDSKLAFLTMMELKLLSSQRPWVQQHASMS